MQLFALDDQKKSVFAKTAKKHQDYYCLECAQVVRVRGGMHRHTHFYHLAATHACRQNGKSMMHLQVQYHLQSLMPKEDCFLEYRFPQIQRIADAFWLSQGIIFEVQCSSITAEEVKERNRDYASLGLQAVWILHDKRFNQSRLTASEQYLRTAPHYFTNIDANGNGIIYDQYSLISKGMRKTNSTPFSICVMQPNKLQVEDQMVNNLPKVIQERFLRWPLYFKGDLLDLFIKETVDQQEIEYRNQILEWEKELNESKRLGWQELFRYWFVRPYSLLFQILLEKMCR